MKIRKNSGMIRICRAINSKEEANGVRVVAGGARCDLPGLDCNDEPRSILPVWLIALSDSLGD